MVGIGQPASDLRATDKIIEEPLVVMHDHDLCGKTAMNQENCMLQAY